MGSDLYTFRDQAARPAPTGGPLAGKRILIQPNMSVRGWPTTAGSRALDGFTALEDATVITRLRNAGACLMGSSRMSELGFGYAGETMGEILSSGEADIGLATDTMGEARLIASGCGMSGFKPSYGIVSRFGLIGLVPSMESYGVIAKDPQDIITVMSVIAGQDDLDVSMKDGAFPDFRAGGSSCPYSTIGVVKPCLQILDDEERASFMAGLAKLEGAGFTLQEVDVDDYDLFPVVHNVVASVEASSAAGKYDGVRYGHRSSSGKNWNDMYLNTRGEAFGSLVKTFLFQGAYFQFENYASFENACRIRNRLMKATTALFDRVDLLALPTRRRIGRTISRPATIGHVYDASLLTLAANVTGLPALQVPSLAGRKEGDTGMQLMGPHLGDARLLSFGVTLSSLLSKGETV